MMAISMVAAMKPKMRYGLRPRDFGRSGIPQDILAA